MSTITQRPFSPSTVIRVLALFLVVLALTAGYYHAAYQTEQRNYAQLKVRYQVLEQTLGIEQTKQVLKDASLP